MGIWDMFRHPDGLNDVEPGTVQAALGAPPWRMVDVRTGWEFRHGHIPGAEPAPWGRTAKRLAAWDRDTPLLLVCKTGHRSRAAAHRLLEMGFGNVSHLAGGMDRWKREGRPLAAGPL